MKKIISIILAVITVFTLATSAFAVSIMPDRYHTIYYGSGTQLTIYTDNPVSFSSSDKKIATVNDSGYITSKFPGECTITATDTVTGQTEECDVCVKLLWWKVFDNIFTFIRNLFVR